MRQGCFREMGWRMARALDGSALGIYCRRLQLSADGVEARVRVRDSPPARTLKGRRGNMPIFFPSEKMGRIIKAESHRIEYARLLENEHDADVLEHYDQPPAIPLDYLDARGHRQQPQHVADFFVIRTHSAGWEECKPSDELTLLGQRQLQRYVCDPKGVWHCPPGEASAATLGLTYHVFPSDHINWVAQSNWQYLDTYYRDAAHLRVAEEVLTQLDALLDETPGMNWADMRRCLPEIDVDAFHTALIHHRIYVDLATYRLEDQARIAIPVYRDRAMALAASLGAVAPVSDLGIEARPVVLETGHPLRGTERRGRSRIQEPRR